MLNKTKQSVITRIGVLMVSLVSLSIVTMFSSVFISDMAEHDAATINLSGSLRMQAYRLVSETDKIKANVDEFDQTLLDNIMLSGFTRGDRSKTDTRYQVVLERWQNVIKPSVIDRTIQISEISSFVEVIELLVQAYQSEAEQKIEWLRIIQLAALFLTLTLVYFSLHSVHHNIALPLRELAQMARKIGAGDFTHRVKVESADELGLLAQSFNHSCNAVSRMYGDLEKRVSNKTIELRRSNRAIQLLYDTAKKLNENKQEASDFSDIIEELSDIVGIKDIDLCLMTANGEVPYDHFISDEQKDLNDDCINKNCNRCIGEQPFTEKSGGSQKLKFPLFKEGHNYGVLVCNVSLTCALADWQNQIIQSVADQIAVALSLKNQSEQTRRISLMDERTTIARELHDSLAQALSYLKIQVTRLQKSHAKEAEPEVIEEITNELKEGLSSAYRQLRELLTTFRLKIDTEGLLHALEETVKQHQSRSEMNIALDFNLGNIPLSPNEEIHLLQIIREATQNAVHHSKGDNVIIGLDSDHSKRIHLSVKDDGVGIPHDPEKLNHYGLVIMKERSRNLGGALNIGNHASGGVCVDFSFVPAYVS